MKKIHIIWIALFLFSWALNACSQDELLLPPAVDNAKDGVIDIVASPTEVTIVGQYDYKYRVIWPTLSDKTSKISITYSDNGEAVTKEYTSFEEDVYIQTKTAGSHEFVLKSYSSTNVISKEAKLVAINKKYIIEETMDVVSSRLVDGEINIGFFNTESYPFNVKISYPYWNGVQVTNTSAVAGDNVIKFPVKDGAQKFVVEFSDAEGRRTSKEFEYNFEFNLVSTLSPSFGVVTLSTSDNSVVSEAKNIKVIYPTTSGTATKEIANSSSITFPAIYATNPQDVILQYVDNEGRNISRSLTYSYNPTLINYNTATLRAGWTPYASNSNSTSEGPPSFMLDADLNKIWHSQWNTTTTSTHTAVQKYPFTLIFTFTQTRAGSASGLFNETGLISPAGPYKPIMVKEISILHRSASNRTVKDVRVYGIGVNGNEIDFGQFTLTNAVQQETIISLTSNTTPLKAIKVICLNTFSATNQFASLNEIYIKGYDQ